MSLFVTPSGDRQFGCEDGSCISSVNVCDGTSDCAEGEDEKNCTCGQHTFSCSDGTCIPISKVCNHVNDCPNGTDDENFCIYPPCKTGQYRCQNGECIDEKDKCNFFKDCLDGSDEIPQILCPCEKCYSGKCLAPQNVDDRYPDCFGVTQEDESLSMIPVIKRMSLNCQAGAWSLPVSLPYCSKTNEMRCTHEHVRCIDRQLACVHDKIKHERFQTCRGFEHLQNCASFQCPHMYKCPGSYCVPLRQVCDGEKDCPRGEDEYGCANYTCPGGFRCKGERQCLHQSEVCNGVVNCKFSDDDERFCDIKTCPTNCVCSGYYVDCTGGNASKVPKLSPFTRGLAFGDNKLHLTNKTFASHHFLVKLNISSNEIDIIPIMAFINLNNLLELDLRGNKLSSLQANALKGLLNLKTLLLSGNPLSRIFPGTFDGVSALCALDLSRLHIKTIHAHTFKGLDSLKNLNISFNKISTIKDGAFQGLPKLDKVDMSGNEGMFVEMEVFVNFSAKTLITDRFGICCLTVGKVDECLPKPDEFSSCSDLLYDKFLQVSVWVMGILSLVGNLFVFVNRLREYKITPPIFFIVNLSVSDFLMGVYLIIIASVDTLYRGEYFVHSEGWTDSVLCKTAGFLTMLSTLMSMLILVLITTDRMIAIVFYFVCWGPVVLLGFLSMANVPIAPQVSNWVAVFVMPFNSAINPYLYTLANVKLCGKKEKSTTRDTPVAKHNKQKQVSADKETEA
ncbi:G-protein coupled receptor GRL101-like [Lingula anatina]|uniref:G-protein coupled receptor GRL101-like n=1 Tax=Lingula anatina TaxID=7574 RepID=A0A2R2MMT5_LINAN|nr:G-protein coupled receptor GRL101-like [Lingula anatina]|eukprot:XP_023931515.1 G-protein coupled receptor GRL101-like [Lingula anatina]